MVLRLGNKNLKFEWIKKITMDLKNKQNENQEKGIPRRSQNHCFHLGSTIRGRKNHQFVGEREEKNFEILLANHAKFITTFTVHA